MLGAKGRFLFAVEKAFHFGEWHWEFASQKNGKKWRVTERDWRTMKLCLIEFWTTAQRTIV